MPNESLKSPPAKPIALRVNVVAAVELESYRSERMPGPGTPSRSEGISAPVFQRLDFLEHLNRPAPTTLGFIVPPNGTQRFQHSVHSPFSDRAFSPASNGLAPKTLENIPRFFAGPT